MLPFCTSTLLNAVFKKGNAYLVMVCVSLGLSFSAVAIAAISR
jgi:hypothetical protein